MRETKWWTWFMAAGVVLFVLLGLHMCTMHTGEITGLFVKVRADVPTALVNSHARDASVAFTAGYVALLGIALYHGLYGLRTILFELSLKPATQKVVTAILVLAGVGLFGLGSWANVVAHGKALGG